MRIHRDSLHNIQTLHALKRDTIRETQISKPGLTATLFSIQVQDLVYELEFAQRKQHFQKIV